MARTILAGKFQRVRGVIRQVSSDQNPPVTFHYTDWFIGSLVMAYYLVVSTHLKNMSQIGNLPQISG